MRFPVFSARANPRIDAPILRKSKSYVYEQVALGMARWVDESKHYLGIVAMGTLYFGERPMRPEPEDPFKLPPREVPGVFFQPPQSYQWQLDHRTVSFLTDSTSRSI